MVPSSEQFRKWVDQCLAELGMPISRFLLDGTPGERNKAARALRAQSIKMDLARRLQSELREAAKRKGCTLPPLEAVECEFLEAAE